MKYEKMIDEGTKQPYDQLVLDIDDQKEKKYARAVKAYIEAEIQFYHQSVQYLEDARKDIILASPDPDQPGGRSGISDPTGRTAALIISHETLQEVARTVKAIREVIESLPDEKKRLVRLRYWNKEKLSWPIIAMKLGIGEATCKRWRDQIVKQIAEKIGKRVS